MPKKLQVSLILLSFLCALLILSFLVTEASGLFFTHKIDLLKKSGAGVVIFYLLFLLLVLFYQKKVFQLPIQELGFNAYPSWKKELFLAYITAFLLALSYGVFGVLAQKMTLSFDAPLKQWLAFCASLLFPFFVAFAEETLFRGFFLNLFQRGYSKVTASLLSSFLFAFSHNLKTFADWTRPDQIFKFIGLFILGNMFCSAKLWRKSLFLPIGLHAGFVTYRLLIRKTHLFKYDIDDTQNNLLFGVIDDPRTALITWAVFSLMLLFFIYKNKKSNLKQ
ncbi:MAG: CPBP family intramembrane metalloprotease [Deltaproteobacteria bacterium]|nr:CPBP family intramembrane metalloprotease [Deltaproteobacteria bacterium]